MDALYIVPIRDQWLLYAPWHATTALVNEAALLALKGVSSFRGNVEDLSHLLSAKPTTIPQPRRGPLRPEFLGIIPTRLCNLGCIYCGFHDAHAKMENMAVSLALSAVDWMTEYVRRLGMDAVEVHFFGGEPLCAPDVVDVVIHRTRARAAELGLIPRFELDTNGYFDSTRCQFVGDYIDSVVLSIDGPEAVHNRQRPTKSGGRSFDTIVQNAHRLSKSPTRLCFRVCITQDNVRGMEELTNWFCDAFRPSIINFETLKPTPQSKASGLTPPDPFEFAGQYMKSHFAALRHGVVPLYAAADINSLRYSFCPVGRDALIISPDGRVSACYLLEQEWKEKGLDLNMGSLDETEGMTIDRTAVKRIRSLVSENKIRCKKCFARWHCGGGCHVANHDANATSFYDDFCVQTRIITACMLLEELGERETLELLIKDKKSLERLAFFESDALSDWCE
jgi:uncharacterized protein